MKYGFIGNTEHIMQLKKIYHYFSFVNGKSMVRKHQRFYLLGQIDSQSLI